MAVAFVQVQIDAQTVTNGSSVSYTVNLLHAFTAGNTLVGFAQEPANTNLLSSITDSAGNTYTIIDTNSVGSASAHTFGLANITGTAPTSLTFHFSSAPISGNLFIAVAEYSGAASFDVHVMTRLAAPAGTSPTAGSITPTVSNCMIFAASDINSTGTITAGSGFTLDLNGGTSGSGLSLEHRLQTTAVAVAASFNASVGDAFSCTIGVVALVPAGSLPPVAVATYYVDSSIGSDSADGLSPTITGGHGPWLTIAHVNGNQYSGGTNILFNAATTFSGAIVMGTANWGTSPAPSSSAPVTFGSYGTGAATIDSSTAMGFSAINIGGFILQNLGFGGDGVAGSHNFGISINNTHSPDTTYDFVQVNNCTVSGYGRSGLFIHGTSGTGGFSNISITGTTVHDCGGFTGTPFTSGLEISSPVSTASVISGIYNFTNVLVFRCTVYNIPGTGNSSSSSGAPIYISECNNALITLCVAHDSSSNNADTTAGVAGIELSDSLNSTIQFCEAYNMSDGHNVDGDGFNLASSINGTIEYCYSHDNNGSGYLIDNGSNPGANSNATLRYCISQNDGNNPSNNLHCGISIVNETNDGVSTNIYNNTVYSSNGSDGMLVGQANYAGITGRVNNNIFYTTTGASVRSAGNSPIVFDGNDYHRTGGTSLVWNGTTYTSITGAGSWHAAFTSQETVNGGFTGDPSLTSPGGGGTTGGYNPGLLTAYRLLSGSPMLGVGLNLSSLFSINPGTQDYYGARIPHGSGSGFPVGAAGAITTPSLPLLGVGMIGWRASLLGAAAWKLGKAIAKNGIITRRRFLLPK